MSAPHRLLLVEDSETQAIRLEYVLQKEGWQVTWVNSAARAMAGRVCLVEPATPAAGPVEVLREAEEALWSRSVVTIEYFDRNGRLSSRAVEPIGLAGGGEHWYLVAWCRLREGIREFRLDRVRQFARTEEVALPRLATLTGLNVGDLGTTPLRLEADNVRNADRRVPARRVKIGRTAPEAYRRDFRVDGQHEQRACRGRE